MKYSILMPYLSRLEQFKITLYSLAHWYRHRADWELILVADSKNTQEELKGLSELLIDPHLAQLPVRVISSTWTTNHNPAPLYNEARNLASGEYVILTSPECMHSDDILAACDEIFHDDSGVYAVFNCLHIRLAASPVYLNGSCVLRTIGIRWYQHPEHRPSDYHFCSALRASVYDYTGGFCEEYAEGVGYDDNDFRDSIIAANIPIVRDARRVNHLEHAKWAQGDPRRRILTARNRDIFSRRCKERGMELREN